MAGDGRLILSDFGISRLLINSVTIAGTTSIKGNMRWMAPELILPEEGVVPKHSCHTRATDVWAFGMVVYVYSEHVLWITPCASTDIVIGSAIGQCTVPYSSE